MGILQLPTQVPAQVGIFPNSKFMVTTDSLATITTAGYLNGVSLQSNPISATDVLQVLYDFNLQTQSGSFGIFTVAVSTTGVITLSSWSNPGEVVLPTTANYLAHFTNTTGTLSSAAGNVIQPGNIQAGLSGTPGTLASFPATANNGSLIISALNAGGAFTTTVRNSAMAQSSVISIPDPGAATANFMLNTGVTTMAAGSRIVLAKANGTEAANAVTANGMAGVITTSSLTTAAGASYAITWTNSAITATSVVVLTLQGGTNTIKSLVFECVPGAGTATLNIYNIGLTDPLDGTILIGFSVL